MLVITPLSNYFGLTTIEPKVTTDVSKHYNDKLHMCARKGREAGTAVGDKLIKGLHYGSGKVDDVIKHVRALVGEVGTWIGAAICVPIAGGKALVGASTQGTIESGARAGNYGAKVGAAAVTGVISMALYLLSWFVEGVMKIVPPALGTAGGVATGTALASISSILVGIGSLLNSISGLRVAATTPSLST